MTSRHGVHGEGRDHDLGPLAPHGADRGGYALIGVLWLVVLISVLGLELAVEARRIANRVTNAADQSLHLAAAESGVVRVREILARRLVEEIAVGGATQLDPWTQVGRFAPDTLEIGEARVVVTLRDVGSMLHLNRASEQELRRLFAAVRVDDGDADRLAQTILDWRDVDELRRGRGAEREEYVERGAAVLPRNGPFASVAELRRVEHMTDEIFRRVEPFLTVEGSGRINPASAPAEVLSALPGMSDNLLSLILRRRASGGPVSDLLSLTADLDPPAREAIRQVLPQLTARLASSTEEVLVRSEAYRDGSPVRGVATAVIVRVDRSALVSGLVMR